jgi:hypothetical protein
MRSIGESVRATLDRLGLRGGVARAAALRAWPEAASRVVGAEATRTRALRVHAGTIVVAVASPVLAQELRLRQEDLIVALGRLAPEAGIRALRFVPR